MCYKFLIDHDGSEMGRYNYMKMTPLIRIWSCDSSHKNNACIAKNGAPRLEGM